MAEPATRSHGVFLKEYTISLNPFYSLPRVSLATTAKILSQYFYNPFKTGPRFETYFSSRYMRAKCSDPITRHF
jgi:hypothetical protein